MPAGMSKFDREPEISGQLSEKFPERLPAVFRRERGRELDKNDLQFLGERFDGAQESV